jgi:hypothetical protein
MYEYYLENPETYEEPPKWWYDLQDEIEFNEYLKSIDYIGGVING